MNYEDRLSLIERRCRECRQDLGDWHDKDCMVGRGGPGRVRDVDVETVKYVRADLYAGAVGAIDAALELLDRDEFATHPDDLRDLLLPHSSTPHGWR